MILQDWNKLLNTECVVIRIGDEIIYPIFKNASTNLLKVRNETFVNEQIQQFDSLTVFFRDPVERFTSAVNKYCQINKLDVEDTMEKIRGGHLIDRHFVPQWVWLVHLYKYYKKQVKLKPMSAVSDVCSITNKKRNSVPVVAPQRFIEADQKIMKHMDTVIDLEFLVKEYKVVLS